MSSCVCIVDSIQKVKVDVRSTASTAKSQPANSASMTTMRATDSDASKVNHTQDQRVRVNAILI